MGGRIVDWLGQGLAADRPLVADMPAKLSLGGLAFYYSFDGPILSLFDADVPDWVDLDIGAISSLSFETLSDVDWTTPPTDGQVFKWDNTAGKLVPYSIPAVPNTEAIQDIIGAMFTDGSGITTNYDDATGTILVTCNILQYTDEQAQDAVAALIAAGTHTGLTVSYNDAGNGISFTVSSAYVDGRADARIAAASIDALADVDTTTVAPADNDVLTYDSGTGKWAPAASAGGGGTPATPTIRASRLAVNNGTSCTVTLPTGSIAGDVCVLFAASGYIPTNPTGWISLYLNTAVGTFFGLASVKILTSADITAGSVTVNFGGSYYCYAGLITLTGTTVNGIRSFYGFTGNAGAANTFYNLTALATDRIIGVVSNRANSSVNTATNFTVLQTASNADCSAALVSYTGTPSILGVVESAAHSVASGNLHDFNIAFR